MKNILSIFLSASVILNIFFLVKFFNLQFSLSLYETVQPRYGILKDDVKISIPSFDGKAHPSLVTLPKGLTVKDVSNTNTIGQFQPHRFSITVTSDKELVEYTSGAKNPYNEFYTADDN